MRYSHIAHVARATTGLARPAHTHRLSTRSYATAASGSSHLVRNGLLAAGLLGAAGATYFYPDMFGIGAGGGDDDSKSKLETL